MVKLLETLGTGTDGAAAGVDPDFGCGVRGGTKTDIVGLEGFFGELKNGNFINFSIPLSRSVSHSSTYATCETSLTLCVDASQNLKFAFWTARIRPYLCITGHPENLFKGGETQLGFGDAGHGEGFHAFFKG